jgi:outer membrane protein OmpA-like peptidoglycan-associated protein
MKKCILVAALAIGALSANAQIIENSKVWDNWSIGLRAGGMTPLTHSAFFKNTRPVFGLEINKQLTPVVGFSIQGMGAMNFMPSATAFDASDVSLLGRVNLMNLFGGYNGKPRVFEIEALAGLGWLHYYQNSGLGDDQNALSTRLGLNLNFNLGESRAWTLSVRPAIAYDMESGFRDFTAPKADRFNANNAMFELTAGLTYHFATSSGDRYLSVVKEYDQSAIDDMNAAVNALRGDLNDRDAALVDAANRISALQRQLDDCLSKPVVEPVVVEEKQMIPETIVTFRQNKSTVDNSQLPNVERVATFMKNHPNAKVAIKGYASPEGSAEVNERIAKARAEAVKKILVSKYRIDESRVTAEGQGVGDMFSEPDWNRVSICTIAE